MNKRSWLLALAAVVAVGGALLVGVAVQAQEAQQVPSEIDDLGAAELGEAPFEGRFGMREMPEGALGSMLGAARERMAKGAFGGRGHGMKGGMGDHMQIVADELGLTVEELRAELESGKTIAEVAAEQGVALEDLEAAILAKVKEHLDEAVADGSIDQERADEMLVMLEQRLSDMLTKQMPARGERGAGGPGHMMQGAIELMDLVADELGIEKDDLLAALRDGTTIEELADEQGVALEDLETAILAKIAELLDQAVADGTIDQEAADKMLEHFQENIGDHLTGEAQFGRGGRGGPGGRGGRGGPGGCGGDFGGFDAPSDAVESAGTV